MPKSTTWIAEQLGAIAGGSLGWSAAPPAPEVRRNRSSWGEGKGRIDGLATGPWSQSREAELQDLGRKRLISAFKPSPAHSIELEGLEGGGPQGQIQLKQIVTILQK